RSKTRRTCGDVKICHALSLFSVPSLKRPLSLVVWQSVRREYPRMIQQYRMTFLRPHGAHHHLNCHGKGFARRIEADTLNWYAPPDLRTEIESLAEKLTI